MCPFETSYSVAFLRVENLFVFWKCANIEFNGMSHHDGSLWAFATEEYAQQIVDESETIFPSLKTMVVNLIGNKSVLAQSVLKHFFERKNGSKRMSGNLSTGAAMTKYSNRLTCPEIQTKYTIILEYLGLVIVGLLLFFVACEIKKTNCHYQS